MKDSWADRAASLLVKDSANDFYKKILYRESTGSSNEWMKEAGEAGDPSCIVGIAEEQTAGKGRLGRTWVSPKGENIYFSLLLRPDAAPRHAASLTLVMGLSTAQAIRETTGLPVGIKWPNDVVINHRKVCGILTEMKADPEKIDYVVIGIGINVNQTEFTEGISATATSLRLEADMQEIDRADLLVSVLRHFRENFILYEKTEDLFGLREEYDALLVNRGERVRIEDPKGPYTAVSKGIDATGALIVVREDGTEERISSGEVSVRGLYGYV